MLLFVICSNCCGVDRYHSTPPRFGTSLIDKDIVHNRVFDYYYYFPRPTLLLELELLCDIRSRLIATIWSTHIRCEFLSNHQVRPATVESVDSVCGSWSGVR